MNFRIDNLNDNLIREISELFHLRPETSAILVSRGITKEEDIEYFLNPGIHHFVDPFKLKGVRETVERIKIAKEEEEMVVIYGDYDADGICATAIMYLALREYGINAIPFVPERAGGYGLSVENIDYIMDKYLPSLIITVDCGISGYNEVEYLKDLAVDVIVTDHHELPDLLPDTLTVNCKIPSEYGFDSLCGAGVAFKIACALIGDRAYKYLDYAAIATIADSMPLIRENRDIVYEGVKLIKSGRCCPAVKELIAISNVREITSTSLAYVIAPRINAAGRMGDAFSALKLMISDDNGLIEQLCLKLNTYNQSRQSECEMLYKSAREKLVATAYDKKIIILEDDSWNGGLVGIIASKLVEEFSRPVILFVNNNGKLHGSARSVESINIFDAISSCKEYLTDFGGHSQAAGISLNIENFQDFKAALEKYVDDNYSYDCFAPVKYADLLITSRFTIELAKELNRLEPFGTANRKPVFAITARNTKASPIKVGSPHLSIRTDYIEMLYFNSSDSEAMLDLPFEKTILFEPNVSVFNHEESLKGYVKDVEYTISPTLGTKLCGFRESLLTALNDNDDYLYISGEMTEKVVSETLVDHFGTIYVAYNIDNLEAYSNLLGLNRYLYSTSGKNLVNNVVIALREPPFSGYKKIVYLDRPLGNVNYNQNITETFINRSARAFDYTRLDLSKETFAEVFRRLCKYNRAPANNSIEFVRNCDIGYDKFQTIFVLEVFIELGIFNFTRGELRYNSNIKSSLSASRIYTEVQKLQD